jgi:hypothetical protein
VRRCVISTTCCFSTRPAASPHSKSKSRCGRPTAPPHFRSNLHGRPTASPHSKIICTLASMQLYRQQMECTDALITSCSSSAKLASPKSHITQSQWSRMHRSILTSKVSKAATIKRDPAAFRVSKVSVQMEGFCSCRHQPIDPVAACGVEISMAPCVVVNGSSSTCS